MLGGNSANQGQFHIFKCYKKYVRQQKPAVQSPAIRSRACLSSAGALLSKPGRHLLLGQNCIPRGGTNTPNSGKDKIQFLHEMDKDTTTSPTPPRDSGICRGRICALGNKACLQVTFQFGLPDSAQHGGTAQSLCAGAESAVP